jgi:hypothetical protein
MKDLLSARIDTLV